MNPTPAALSGLFTNYAVLYNQAYKAAPKFYDKVAMQVPSSTSSMTHGWMDKIPVMREWLGPRIVQNASVRSRVVVNKTFELTESVPKEVVEDDQFGLYAPVVQQMGMQAAKWPDYLIADKIIENPTCFDAKAFFATDHPVDVDGMVSGTYANLLTTSALNFANFAAAHGAMRNFKGADGKPIGATPSLLMVPPALEAMARAIVHSTQIAPQYLSGSAAAMVGGQDNVWKGAVDLLVVPELSKDSDSSWYLLDTTNYIRPFVFQLRQAPNFVYRNKPTDDNVFWHRDFIFGVDARGAADVTLPFLAIKCTA